MKELIEKLKALNPDLELYCVCEPEFAEYGCVFGFDTTEMLEAAADLPKPTDGTVYKADEPILDATALHETLQKYVYGGMPVQSGYCNGANLRLDCFEYHRGMETLIAVTDLILLLAKKSELKNMVIDSSCTKAFFVPKGKAVGVYETSLHYAPVMVNEDGFRAIINLPKGTNEPFEVKPEAQCKESEGLLAVNKWLVAHPDTNEAKTGALVGITGANITVRIN